MDTGPTTLSAAKAAIRRCPACGHRIDESNVAQCPLCEFRFREIAVTAADATPYAQAYAEGRSGLREMAEWVWFAETERLKHIALIQASAASRSFARWNVFFLALALAIFQTSEVGWRWVRETPALEPTASIHPRGQYWAHVAQAPRPLPPEHPPEKPVDLWWNPLHAAIGLAAAFSATWLAAWILGAMVRKGVTSALGEAYRKEKRMSAAVHYSTAWAMVLVVASLVAALRPISYFGEMARWPWYPRPDVFVLSAAVVAGLGAVLWWYWLVRLGSTAPAKVRTRVVGFFAVGTPLLAGAVAAGWYYGLSYAYDPLMRLLGVAF